MCPLYDTFITSGDGKTVAIGNPWNANNGEQSGLARVYRIDGKLNWKEMGQGFFGEKLKDGNVKNAKMLKKLYHIERKFILPVNTSIFMFSTQAGIIYCKKGL